MAIKPGEDWGAPVERSPLLRVALSDRQLAAMATSGADTPISVAGGDLYRSLGSPRSRRSMRRVPIDMIQITVDSGTFQAVAHVALYRSLWRGSAIAVCNCSEIGSWNVAPRAHPNDGLLDIVEVSAEMAVRARWQARSRLVTGTHLPHPDISYERVTTKRWEFERSVHCYVDGERVGRTKTAEVTVLPDAFDLDF